MPKSLRIALPVTAVAVAGLVALAVLQLELEPDPEMALAGGIVLPEPRPVAEVELIARAPVAHSSAAISQAAGACSSPASRIVRTSVRPRSLSWDESSGGRTQTVFLSVDPARDTPERLAQYMAHFSPGFIGATGDNAEIDALCDSLAPPP